MKKSSRSRARRSVKASKQKCYQVMEDLIITKFSLSLDLVVNRVLVLRVLQKLSQLLMNRFDVALNESIL